VPMNHKIHHPHCKACLVSIPDWKLIYCEDCFSHNMAVLEIAPTKCLGAKRFLEESLLRTPTDYKRLVLDAL